MLADVILKVAGMEQGFWDEAYRPRPSAAGRCIRALVYKRMGLTPEPWPDRFAVIFDDGNWHEELTVQWLQKSAFTIHSQQLKVHIGTVAGQEVTGEIDGVVEDPVGWQAMWEHKAINHFTFQRYLKRIEDGLGLDLADPYFAQIQLYLHSTEMREAEIDTAVLLIKNKNTGQYCEFIVEYDKGAAINALVKLETVERCARLELVPDRPYNRNVDWQCSYCRYARRCWEGYDGEREEERTTEDSQLIGAIGRFDVARREYAIAYRQREDAKAEVVHLLDAAKAQAVRTPDGMRAKWEKKFRKGYTVEPASYFQLTVTRLKEEGKK